MTDRFAGRDAGRWDVIVWELRMPRALLAVVVGAFAFSDLVMMKYLAFGLLMALLLDAIIERQQALRAEGLELADEVFSESARTESRIVGLLWRQAAK